MLHAKAEKRGPAWGNEGTLRAVERLTEFEAGSSIARRSATPRQRIIGARDPLVVSDLAFSTCTTALEPKRLVILTGAILHLTLKGLSKCHIQYAIGLLNI